MASIQSLISKAIEKNWKFVKIFDGQNDIFVIKPPVGVADKKLNCAWWDVSYNGMRVRIPECIADF